MVPKKRRNPQDATRVNVRAANKRLDALAIDVAELTSRIEALEQPDVVSDVEPCPPVSTVRPIEND